MDKIVRIGLLVVIFAFSVLFFVLFAIPALANNQPVDSGTATTVGASVAGSTVLNQLIDRFKQTTTNQQNSPPNEPNKYSLEGLNLRLESSELTNQDLSRKLRFLEKYLRRKFPEDFDPKDTF